MEGRRGASRRHRRSSRGRRTRSSAVLTGVLVTLLVCFVGIVVVGAVGASNYYNGLTHLDELQQVPQGQNSAIYARDGSRLTVIASDKNRRFVSLARISKWLPAATIAIEDRRFYEHHGVDWRAVGRAAIKNIEAGRVAEGGSTLTQQLVRNIYPQITREVTLKRKLNEALVARELEDQHPKQWILEQYLNTVPYGHSAYGAEAAAQIYFSQSARDLTIAQAALLAGLPQGPSRYDPFVHASAAKDRRAEVLQAMLDQGVITQAEYNEANASKLGLKRGDLFGRTTEPYVEQYVRSQLESDTEFGSQAVLGGGLKVTTTIDPRLQKLAYNAMRGVLKLPPCSGAPKASCDPAAALVSIRPSTGEIVAMTSTSKFKNTQFNFAQGQRQPGSTFKPFTLAAAIEAGINPATTYYKSAPFNIDKGDQWGQIYGPWNVHTAEGGYHGRISLERATLASDNTVYAQLILDVGPEEVKDVAQRMGINQSTLTAVPSLTLGSNSVTPLEMASAYASFAAQGVYRKPRIISKITFAGSDRVVKVKSKAKRVMADGVAAEVTRILGQNMHSGTGTRARMSDNRPQAGKTGTTDNVKDAWFCGFTPDLATCVWIGYPISERYPLRGVEGVGTVYGGTLPAAIWHGYMDGALAKVAPHEFPKPKNPPTFISNFRSEFTERAVYVAPPPPPDKKKSKGDKPRDGGAAGGGR
ncbi:MAG: penicillin-binding protein [Gaiellaceae bacterium]|nr:penicillin-binding protein [Gaiellaceae bacterium]